MQLSASASQTTVALRGSSWSKIVLVLFCFSAGTARAQDAGVDADGGVDAGEQTTEAQQAAPLRETPVEATNSGLNSEPPGLGDMVAPTIEQGIVGRLLDDATSEPIIEGPVVVVDHNRRATTDLDGNFAIALPPGTYTLRSYYNLYEPARVESITVVAGQTTNVDIRLHPSGSAPEQEVVVTARADTSTAATLLEMRRQSATVSDAISAEEIRRMPDTTASDSVRRVVGVSIVNNQYALVRGLGGRYVNVLLNGVPLPSTDPDVPGVQLDLFPVALLNSLNLVKTFAPEMPGDFAGGSLQIASREFPSRFTLTANVSLGADTLTHNGAGVLRYRGGSLDWLGFDDGKRALPGAVPNVLVRNGRNNLTLDDVTRIGRSFENTWNIGRATPLPQMGLGITVGDTVQLGGKPFGYLLSLGYSNTPRRALDTLRTLRSETDANNQTHLAIREEFQQETYTNSVLWGALGTANYQPAPNHEIGLVALYTQSTTDFAGIRTGYNESIGSDTFFRQLQFVERSLFFAQLVGDHRELPLHSRLRWQLFAADSGRSEPDTRQVTYLSTPGSFAILAGPGNLARLFSGLNQVEGGGAADYELPIADIMKLRAGVFARLSDRNFSLRRFSYNDRGVDPALSMSDPETYFAPQNLGADLQMQEYTGNLDGYRAIQQLFAGFVRAEGTLFDRLRLVGGVRVESFRQWVSSRSPFADAPTEEDGSSRTDRTDINVLPSAAAIWSITPKMNLRLSYGGTVARPLVRELAPYVYYDFLRNRSEEGNPRLVATTIQNVDLRWEYFLSETEVFAASVFFKHFTNPLERIFQNRDGTSASFTNAAGAINIGGELEARVSLGRISDVLTPFSIGANLAIIHSQVELSPEQQMLNYSGKRPLAGQSPFLSNVQFAYAPEHSPFQAYLYYNVFGPRIEDVGVYVLPDVYQDTFHQLDAALVWEPIENFSIRVTAKNILFQRVVLRQDDVAVQRTSPMTSFALRATWTY